MMRHPPVTASKIIAMSQSLPAQDPNAQINLLRQQLILAQVRIMEMEDQNTSFSEQITENETLLKSAQQLADTKLDEVRHLTGVLATAQSQIEHQQQQQHALQQSLAETQAALASIQDRLRVAEQAALSAENELARIKSSRLWRWTRWLRQPEHKTPPATP
jgi:chromosome segregation ATPase